MLTNKGKNEFKKNLSCLTCNIRQNIKRFKQNLKKCYCKKISRLIAIQKELQDILKVSRTLNSGFDLKRAYALITKFTCELMHTDICVLRIFDEHRNSYIINSGSRVSDSFVHKIPALKIGEDVCRRIIKAKRFLVVQDISKDKKIRHKELLIRQGFKSILAMPIILRERLLGVISTYSKKKRRFTKEEIELLNIFSSQLAMAIQESKHSEYIHISYFNAIHALVLALEARDPYTRGHTERVTRYALDIARALKMSPAEMEDLRYAGEVHDIGKISIPDFILNKPGKLSPAERAVIQLHPVKGAEVLEPLEFLKSAIPIVRHHHERYDGKGYPDGLIKENIPIMARILACADSFDAMTSQRPYRQSSLTVKEAVREIKDNSGTQFDPRIAGVFIRMINSNKTFLKTSI
jgi:putative nucleotidyltransferase with HDIG domain